MSESLIWVSHVLVWVFITSAITSLVMMAVETKLIKLLGINSADRIFLISMITCIVSAMLSMSAFLASFTV